MASLTSSKQQSEAPSANCSSRMKSSGAFAAARLTAFSLLTCFALLSSPIVQRRKMFVKLVEDVKAYGGEVLIFSSMHESGQRESTPALHAILSEPTLTDRPQNSIS